MTRSVAASTKTGHLFPFIGGWLVGTTMREAVHAAKCAFDDRFGVVDTRVAKRPCVSSTERARLACRVAATGKTKGASHGAEQRFWE